jgi:hypothetical protein
MNSENTGVEETLLPKGLRGEDNDRLKVIGSRMTAAQIEDALSADLQLAGAPDAARPVSSQRIAMPVVSTK